MQHPLLVDHLQINGENVRPQHVTEQTKLSSSAKGANYFLKKLSTEHSRRRLPELEIPLMRTYQPKVTK